MKNNIALLDLMMSDQREANPLYLPGPHWQAYQGRILQSIRKHGVAAFRSSETISKGYGDPLLLDPIGSLFPRGSLKDLISRSLIRLPFLQKLVFEQQNLIRSHANRVLSYRARWFGAEWGPRLRELARNDGLPETMIGGCENYVEQDDRRYAYLYLSMLRLYQGFRDSGVPFDSARGVMEIGGGFGALSHLALHRHPNIRKILYVDIPPMIYVATQYLKHFFGNAVIDYGTTRNRPALSFADSDDLEIFCICPWQIETMRGRDVDIFLNSTSFQEMLPEAVDNYATHTKRLMNPREAHLCLFMTPPSEETAQRTTDPDRIKNAFGPEFEVSRLPDLTDLEGVRGYHLGTRRFDSAR